jgi:hypothetical protein
MEVGAGNTWPCYRNAVRTSAVRAPRTSNFLKSRNLPLRALIQ